MHRLSSLVLSLVLLPLAFTPAQEKPAAPSGPAGLWLGVLKVGPIDLRLAFQLDRDKEGKLSGKGISLDQNRAEIPIKTATFVDGKLTLDMPSALASFTGSLDKKGNVITGTFKQVATSYPLKLERIAKLPTSNRPQTPKKPFPYLSEDVQFKNASAKIELAGTLTLPKGEGPFPAVVLVSGSGPQDRDETIFEHKPFLVLADHLARQGIACLRFDDRGIGKSGGKFAGATSADFATDAHAAVEFLRASKKIDAKRVGVCGHSEGGIIAPMVAVEHPEEVGFIILMAGPGITGERLMHQQIVDFSNLLGEKTDEKEVKQFTTAVMPVLKSTRTTAEVKEELKKVLQKLGDEEKDEKKRKEFEKGLPTIVGRLSDPWMRWFICHDPAPVLKKVQCPVLALNGEKDLQVKARQNLEVIEAALKAGRHKDFTCVELKGLNHLFQTCKTGYISEYGQIEETIAPDVLERISTWIKARK